MTVNTPILFSLYTSDVLIAFGLNSGNGTYSIAYADDLIVYVANAHIEPIKKTLEELVTKINSYYSTWNLRVTPVKCETILFRNPRCSLSTKKAEGVNTFAIKTKNPDSGEVIEIPTKEAVKYLGFWIDNRTRGTIHVDIQVKKAKSAFAAMNRMFINRALSAKVIRYQISVRSLLTYAAPVWWNLGAAQMEKLRVFERTCLRAALGKFRSAHSKYKHTCKIINE